MRKLLSLLLAALVVSVGLEPSLGAGSFSTKQWRVSQKTLATFSASATGLTVLQMSQVKAAVDANPDAEKFICTGIRYYQQPMSQNILVRKRAKAACEYAKQLNPSLSTWYQNKPTQARSYAGRVLLTIKTRQDAGSDAPAESSSPLPAAPDSAPVLLSGFPNVIGDPSIGGTLSLAPTSWSGSNYQKAENWYSCPSSVQIQQGGTAIPSSCEKKSDSSSTLQVSADLAGHVIVAQTIVSNSAGITVIVTFLNVPVGQSEQLPSLQYAGNIIGSLAPSNLLFVDEGNWAGTAPISTSTNWFSCPTASTNTGVGGQVPEDCNLASAGSLTYSIRESDRGKFLVTVTRASNSVGASTVVRQTAARVPLEGSPPTLKAVGSISGLPKVGSQLSVTESTWESRSALTLEYSWFACSSYPQQSGLGAQVPSDCARTEATGKTYSPRFTDKDMYLVALERARNSFGTSNTLLAVRSRVTAIEPPIYVSGAELSGTFVVDKSVNFEPGTWSSQDTIQFSYAVFLCSDQPTSNSLDFGCVMHPSLRYRSRLTTFSPGTRSEMEPLGKFVVVQVSARNSAGTTTQLVVSPRALRIAPPSPTLQVAPSISTPSNTVGETVEIVKGQWTGSYTTSVKFRVCIFEDCADAGTTYNTNNMVLDSTMVGKYVQLIETAESDGGPGTTAASNSIGPVVDFRPPGTYATITSPTSNVAAPGQSIQMSATFFGNPLPSLEQVLYSCQSVPTSTANGALFNPAAHDCEPRIPLQRSDYQEYTGPEKYLRGAWGYTASDADLGRYVVWLTRAFAGGVTAQAADWVLVGNPTLAFAATHPSNIKYLGSAVQLDNSAGLSNIQAHLCTSRFYGLEGIHIPVTPETQANCTPIESYGVNNAVVITPDMYANGFGKYIGYSGEWSGIRIWSNYVGPTASIASNGAISAATAPTVLGNANVGNIVRGIDTSIVPEGLTHAHEWFACGVGAVKSQGSVFTSEGCESVGVDSELEVTGALLGRALTYVRHVQLQGSGQTVLSLWSNWVLAQQ